MALRRMASDWVDGVDFEGKTGGREGCEGDVDWPVVDGNRRKWTKYKRMAVSLKRILEKLKPSRQLNIYHTNSRTLRVERRLLDLPVAAKLLRVVVL